MKVRNPYVKQDHDAATPSSSDSLSPAGSQTDSSLTEHSDVNSSSQVSIPHRFYPRWAPLSQEPLKLWKREAKGGSSYCMISQGRYPKRVSVEPFMGQWRIDIRKYHLKAGSWRPTTKGTSLSVQEYRALRDVLNDGEIEKHLRIPLPPHPSDSFQR